MTTAHRVAPALFLAGLAAAGTGGWGCSGETAPQVCVGPQLCPPPSSAVHWAAQILPVNTNHSTLKTNIPLTPQEQLDLPFPSTGAARLAFTVPARVQGVITSSAGLPLKGARVVAQLPSAIPGQSVYSIDTVTDDKGSYVLQLPVPPKPQAQPYRFWVGFDDPVLAAKYPPRSQNAAISGDAQVSLSIRAPQELVTVQGRITDAGGNGVGGMRMQVLDGMRNILSTTVQTSGTGSGPPGSFQMLLDQTLSEDGTLQVVAWPSAQSGDPLLLQELPTVSGSMPLQNGKPVQVNLRLPDYGPPLPFTLTVVGTGTNGAVQPVTGAQVQAQVDLSDPMTQRAGQDAIYTASGQTDGGGQVRLPLVPALAGEVLMYTVTVTSPAGSPFASTPPPFVVQVGSQQGPLGPLTLSLRAQVTGRLVGADGMPVPGAQVVPRALQTIGLGVNVVGTVVLEQVMPEAVTDGNGRFALRLDQGYYGLDLIPQAGTGVRWSIDQKQVVNDDLDLGVIELPQPGLGQVLVVGPDNYAVPGVNVRIFAMPDRPESTACDVLQPCSPAAALRADVYTDQHGQAQVLLPATP